MFQLTYKRTELYGNYITFHTVQCNLNTVTEPEFFNLAEKARNKSSYINGS